jgi:hypothetical protein
MLHLDNENFELAVVYLGFSGSSCWETQHNDFFFQSASPSGQMAHYSSARSASLSHGANLAERRVKFCYGLKHTSLSVFASKESPWNKDVSMLER